MSGSSLGQAISKMPPDQVKAAFNAGYHDLPLPKVAQASASRPAAAPPAAAPTAAQAYGAAQGPMPGLQPYTQVPAWAYALNQQAMAPLFQVPQAGPAMNPDMLQQANYASFLRNFLGG